MKKILLCVTGSIAAYKALELTRLLVKANCEVKVLLTESAKAFVTRLSFEALSQGKVYDDLFAYTDHPIEHIELARWADQIVIAPASANTIAKLALGLADDLLGNVILATDKPIFIAPTMNVVMWQNTAVQANVNQLKNRKFIVLPPDAGEQACGDIGDGRLMEPQAIIKHILKPKIKTDKHVVITAGPTVEALDPVRYLSNHSSGKMGYALAEAFVDIGWGVTLISGPTQLIASQGCDVVQVRSANEMHDAVLEKVKTADLFIAAAAVADYRPQICAVEKIKKTDESDALTLKLIKNKDILASVASLTKNRPCCVGFAAETHNAREYALAKIERKNLDFLILNQVNTDNGFPFYSDHNEVQLFNKHHQQVLVLPLASKRDIANQIVNYLNENVIKKEVQTELNYE
ncbi:MULTISPECIES: bifunctional phosphopantothenoylcysteine decarboxylase/phosphopantothenate--cysteine ligase CoaBC [Cysteiniphilum]|uniref:Coenzyme A biosynthesis bifunctional protein CoaBC n=1 Tax=Cysteiniphilum litorale TaxID=2056700 RepID=A0A8J3E8H2_9GAMM|nr:MULTISPECIES: bifunctional phosphopantothenoylcysteine decarboxylase/phosphopantothenate--cysteine ligase CoaBC [Cysteiniphilum]GGF93892.1 coenzyme A biosynthesis bifunctional protein CoaBC [Cysteiniphilum litorale]